MKAGISTATLFLRLNNEDTLPLFSEWGVGVCEVFLTSFSEYSAKFARLLSSVKGNTQVHSVHVINTQFEPQLYAEHPRILADSNAWLRRTLSSAKILGAEHYTFHGTARFKRTSRDDIPRMAERTAEIFATCKRYGVTLCYENVEWAFYNRPGLFRELRAVCPGLRGVLDIKQARLSGYDYREYLNEMAGSLAHVHVSDIDTAGNMCLPGRGSFDFDELFSRLKDVGFQGPVLIENYTSDYYDLGEVKAAYEFLAEKAEKYS